MSSAYEVQLMVTIQVDVEDSDFEDKHQRCFEGIDAGETAQEAVQAALSLVEGAGFSHKHADHASIGVFSVDVHNVDGSQDAKT